MSRTATGAPVVVAGELVADAHVCDENWGGLTSEQKEAARAQIAGEMRAEMAAEMRSRL